MNLDNVSIAAVIVLTSIALYTDLKGRTIPKWLTIPAAITGLAWHGVANGLDGLLLSLGGFATGFGILFVLWLIGGGGGGDVKLMAAIGAWIGAIPTLITFVASAWFAILCSVGLLMWRKRQPQKDSDSDAKREPATSALKSLTIPYALPVAMSIWMLSLIQLL